LLAYQIKKPIQSTICIGIKFDSFNQVSNYFSYTYPPHSPRCLPHSLLMAFTRLFDKLSIETPCLKHCYWWSGQATIVFTSVGCLRLLLLMACIFKKCTGPCTSHPGLAL